MKTCKMCLKEIDQRARKCPYCQHYQFVIRTIIHNPSFILISFVLGWLLVLWFMDNRTEPKDYLNSYSDHVEILNSRIEFGSNSCGETVTIIGNLKNKSDIEWSSPEFEIKYYDKDNNFTDTEQVDKHSFNIPANETLPFKLSMRKEFDGSKYIGYDVRIINARAEHPYY